MAENKKEWYVLRAISGKEAKVKEVLDAAIKNTNLGQYVSQVLIPTEKIYSTQKINDISSVAELINYLSCKFCLNEDIT